MEAQNSRLLGSRLIVLSDLHLWGPADPLYRALVHFIDTHLQTGDKFFIVGDLFDLYVGNKAVFRDRYKELIEQICKLGDRDIEVFYVEGNHDFHLEGLFDNASHVHLYADSFHYEWNGKRFHFCHGDKINWRDFGYQAWRIFTRNLVSQCIIETLPGSFIDKIGSAMSHASRGQHYEADENTVRLFRNYACEQVSNGYDFVIMGHSHYADDMRFRVDGHEGQYINVGYPRKHRRYYEMNPGDDAFVLRNWDELLTLRPSVASSTSSAEI